MINSNYPNNGQMINTVASSRWLYVSEIEKLLDRDLSLLPIQRTPPSSPPQSGALLLYDRSITRNYKSDGHDWIKKRNSHKVREDHVKLRVGGKFRVSGCYVHSSSILSFHRRAYHLLDPDTGTALHPVGNSNDANKNNRAPSLVLVHYLDTKIASEHLNNFVMRGVEISESLWPSDDKPTSRKQNQTKSRSQQQQQQEQLHQLKAAVQQQQESAHVPPLQYVQAPQVPQFYQHQIHPAASPMYNYLMEHGQTSDNPLAHALADTTSQTLDNKTLDFLWDVIVEEGQEKTRHASNLSDLLVPGVFEQILERPGAQNLFENKEMLEMAQAATFPSASRQASFTSIQMDNSMGMNFGTSVTVPPRLEMKPPSRVHSLSSKIGHEDEPSSHSSGYGKPASASAGTPIPELIDMTPDMIDFNKSAKVVISFDAPALSLDDMNNEEGTLWRKYLLAFIRVKANGTIPQCNPVSRIHDAKMLNPFCFQCLVKTGSISAGAHKTVLLRAYLEREFSESELIMSANKLLDMALCDRSIDVRLPSDAEHPVLNENGLTLAISSQISEGQFHCIGNPSNNEELSSSASSNKMKEQSMLGDLPAPAPTMALVATVLSDFPSPPPEAVLPPSDSDKQSAIEKTQVPDGLGNVDIVSDDTEIRASESSNDTSGRDDKGASRKRTSSFFDSSEDTNSAPNVVIANKWAMQTSSDPESDTKAEAVDRHCKIRFVEKLTSVISETGGESIVQETLPDSVMTIADEKDGCLVVDTEELKGTDDEQLDRILDSLLVRIVETLVEMSPSECNVEDLTLPDKSGFTLLHYAALYNLQSLIPVLLSRGANPDVQSVRGAVTPLHLACGAGNDAIVELLLRNGCAMRVPDSYGSYPVDHAHRNGFTTLAAMLEEKMAAEMGLKNGENDQMSNQSFMNDDKRKESLKEIERYRLQSAFENLSLKDKMVLNMILKQRKKKVASSKPHNSVETIAEESSENEDDTPMQKQSAQDPSILTENRLRQMKSKSQDASVNSSDDLSSVVISETDRESLDIAMRLMNDGELEELQNKSADIHKDLKQWMLKRNYESLKEASEYLHKTLEEHKEGKKLLEAQPSVKSLEMDFKQQAKIRSLQNMKSQALAALVLRKKLLELRKDWQHTSQEE